MCIKIDNVAVWNGSDPDPNWSLDTISGSRIKYNLFRSPHRFLISLFFNLNFCNFCIINCFLIIKFTQTVIWKNYYLFSFLTRDILFLDFFYKFVCVKETFVWNRGDSSCLKCLGTRRSRSRRSTCGRRSSRLTTTRCRSWGPAGGAGGKCTNSTSKVAPTEWLIDLIDWFSKSDKFWFALNYLKPGPF